MTACTLILSLSLSASSFFPPGVLCYCCNRAYRPYATTNRLLFLLQTIWGIHSIDDICQLCGISPADTVSDRWLKSYKCHSGKLYNRTSISLYSSYGQLHSRMKLNRSRYLIWIISTFSWGVIVFVSFRTWLLAIICIFSRAPIFGAEEAPCLYLCIPTIANGSLSHHHYFQSTYQSLLYSFRHPICRNKWNIYL